MAPLGGDPQAQPVSSMPPQTMIQGQPGVQVPYSGMQQQPPHSLPPMNPAMPKTSVEGPPGAPTGDVIQVGYTYTHSTQTVMIIACEFSEGDLTIWERLRKLGKESNVVTLCKTTQPMRSIPAEKIMKKPIPDEHLVLKTTFEGLIQKCLVAANDPVSTRHQSKGSDESKFMGNNTQGVVLSIAALIK